MSTPLLAIDNLDLRFASDRGELHALHGVSLTVNEGEIVGLVGSPAAAKASRRRRYWACCRCPRRASRAGASSTKNATC